MKFCQLILDPSSLFVGEKALPTLFFGFVQPGGGILFAAAQAVTENVSKLWLMKGRLHFVQDAIASPPVTIATLLSPKDIRLAA